MAHAQTLGSEEKQALDENNHDLSYSNSCPSLSDSNASPIASSSSCQNVRHDFYNQEAAVAIAASMPGLFENGRKVFGPPACWSGPAPLFICEVFLAHVPHHIEELLFSGWFHRFGAIYELRLMMDSGRTNRGYGFLRFSKESEALAAYELLNFRYQGGERLLVFRSQGKNRLYVNNIPKELPIYVVRSGLQSIFPQLMHVKAYQSNDLEFERNRGFAFIDFNNHEDALQAKKSVSPGRVRMWNVDLKVQWAKSKEEIGTLKRSPNGTMNGSFRNVHKQQKYNLLCDFNAKLRMLCLANDWNIPIVLYGRNFPEDGIQYGGILLKSDISGQFCCIIMEVAVASVYDIHLLMCEVAVLIIEKDFHDSGKLGTGFPRDNYVLRVQYNQAELVVQYSTFCHLALQSLRLNLTNHYFRHRNSIIELAESLQMLALYSSQELLNSYKRSFLFSTRNAEPTLHFEETNFAYKIHPILPKFRNNQPLNANLNDAEINLMLDAGEEDDVQNDNIHDLFGAQSSPPRNGIMMYSRVLFLRSQRFPHSFELRYVGIKQGIQFYHPLQQINTPPIWISGHTYQQSFYN